jgi:hypothetical protein
MKVTCGASGPAFGSDGNSRMMTASQNTTRIMNRIAEARPALGVVEFGHSRGVPLKATFSLLLKIE